MGSRYRNKFCLNKMKNKKLIIGISALLIVFGLIFTFLPHDLQELVTFGANIPHFLHLVMGFVIVGTGLACIGYSLKQGTFRFPIDKIKNNLKKPVPLLIILFLVAGFAALKYVTKDVKAETEFDKMKEAAKYCTNPTSTDPKCLESFKRSKSSHMQSQQTAQQL